MQRQQTALIAFLVIALSTGFLLFVVPDCIRMHPAACLGTPDSKPLAPFVYRLLPPALDNLIAPNASSTHLLFVDMFIHAVCVAFTLPLLYRWLKLWSSADRALIGVMVFSIVYLMAYHYYFRSIGTSLEILSVVIALNLLKRSWFMWLPLIVLAAFNRETSLLLVAIYAMWNGWSQWFESLVMLLVWGAVTAAIHLIVGSYPHQLGLLGTLSYNIGNIPEALVANTLLLPLGILAVLGYSHAPVLLKRFSWLAVVYVLAIAVGAAWNESHRLVLPCLPLLIPVILGNPAATLATSPQG